MESCNKSRVAVLFIGLVAPPLGGMTVSLNNLVTSDLQKKYDISVLDITGYRMRRPQALFLAGCFYQLFLIFKLIGILVTKRPRIVYVSIASFLYFYRRGIDIIICKLFLKKVTFRLQGAKFIEFYDESSLLGRAVIRMILRITDRIIALSMHWRNFLCAISTPQKIVVIPNGVFVSEFRLLKNMKKELCFSDEQIFVLFMSPLGRRKGVFDILDAISEVVKETEGVTFLFCGPEEFVGELEQFKKQVKEKGLGNYVKYAGIVTGQEKIDYYMSSDIFILPSYAENLPNALLEGMAAGLPVVVSGVGAIPEIINDGVNGFIIKPGDVDLMAKRIKELIKDERLRKTMGQRNIAIASEKYDMSIIADKLDKVFQELA